MPFSASSTLPLFTQRLLRPLAHAPPRVCLAFFLLGLINNVLYVIILSAALDLVGPSVPKSAVLLADVLPSFATKLAAPYFIHAVPYPARVCAFVALSTAGMLLVALTPGERGEGGTVGVKMAGVVLASLSSGGGELSFLGLTHFYGPFSLAAWGSGTGAAGLVGAGAYVLATTAMGLPVRASLLAFAFLPLVMLVAFFGVLPRGPLRGASASSRGGKSGGYAALAQEEEEGADDAELVGSGLLPTPATAPEEAVEEDAFSVARGEGEGLLGGPSPTSRRGFAAARNPATGERRREVWTNLKANFRRARGLFFPYMLPLLLVYTAEYTINQAVAPTLLFPTPAPNNPLPSYRAFYPTYSALYQTGVFLSRSSTPFLRIHALYAPSLLQCANLALLAAHALYDFLPNPYFVFLVVFWEGLLGGLVYVSTFAEIAERVPEAEREFSLGATSVSDSAGICLAGLVGLGVEGWLCRWQVARGRDYCLRT